MKTRLSARDQKVLLVGLVSCTTLVVGARGVPELLRWTHDARANAVHLGAEAERASKSVATARATHDSLVARNARYLALAPRFLAGETVAGAGGALAALVSGAATAANVRLGAVQIQADTMHQAAFTPVIVRADLTGDIRGLSAVLATLERGQAILAVRELSISQPAAAAGDDQPETLHADLVVECLLLTARREGGR